MDNFLGNLLSLGPTAAPTPLPPPRTYDRATERRARANGFKSAEEMAAWARNREQGAKVQGRRGLPGSVNEAMAWHPKNILGYVLNALGG